MHALWTCCWLLGLVSAVTAQSGRMRGASGGTKGDEKAVLRLVADEVLLPVSVRWEDGRPGSELTRSDFVILEDGKRQQVTSVMRSPANILFILDTSGTVTPLKNVNINRELALKLIERLGQEDRAALLTYADKVVLISDWTEDKATLREALEWKFRPGLKSRFHEALQFAAENVLPKVTGRRAVVLLTDGIDSFNRELFAKALASLHRARATVYVLSHTGMLLTELKPLAFNKFSWYEMLDPQRRKRIMELRRYIWELQEAEAALDRLAEETGGVMWTPTSREEFQGLAGQIAREIEREYIVAYSAEREPDDTAFHRVRVYLKRPGLSVRVRLGVYSSAQANQANGPQAVPR